MTEKRVIAGRYEVGALIGRGGMADVYEGVDTRLGRTVAIKLLKSDLANDPAFEARFRQEAQSSARIAHPTIVRTYDAGEEITVDVHGNEHKYPFIVMELVTGKLLRDLLHEKRLSVEEAVNYATGILTALEFSHRAGVVHRDIKSANVMITPTGQVKVMDFGIARAVSESSATMAHTQGIVGTAQYFSPEQAKGETVDHRTDLYSAGVILYEMLAGRAPFKGETAVSVAYQHVSEAVVPPSAHNPEISAELDAVVLRALAKDRAERFQSAEEFRENLLAASTGSPATIESPLAAVTGTIPAAPSSLVEADSSESAAEAASSASDWDDFEALLADASDKTTVMPAATVEPTVVSTQSPTAAEQTPAVAESQPAPPIVPAAEATEVISRPQVSKPSPAPVSTNTNPFNTLGIELPTQTDSSPKPVFANVEKPSTNIMWIIGSAAAVIIVGLFIWLGTLGNLNLNINTDTGIKVADISNQPYDQAVTALTDQGLLVSKVFEASETVAKDAVIRTDPVAGTSVPKNTLITVYVSSGKDTVLVPNLAGMTEAEAAAAIISAKLTLGTIEQANSASVPDGKVIESLPGLNSQVEAGSTVNLIISNGQVDVPDVRNLSTNDARAILTSPEVGFTVSIVTDAEPCSGTPGTIVLDQSIMPGPAPQRSNIVLTVACQVQ